MRADGNFLEDLWQVILDAIVATILEWIFCRLFGLRCD